MKEDPEIRSIEQIIVFCETMKTNDDYDSEGTLISETKWHQGYAKAMEDVLHWIATPSIVMVPKEIYDTYVKETE